MRNKGQHRQIVKKNLTVPIFLEATVENSSLNISISSEFTQRGCLLSQWESGTHTFLARIRLLNDC